MNQMQPIAHPEPAARPSMKPGWYRDLPNAAYHASAGVSSSQLKKLLDRTPAHLRHGPALEQTESMRLGTAVHTLVLEPQKFEREIVVLPELNLRKKADRQERDALLESSDGRTLVSAAQFERAQAMAFAVHDHPTASALIEDVIAESSIYWHATDDETGARQLQKVRPDAICRGHNVLLDIKTCADASYTGFVRTVEKYAYHLSAAMYLEGVNQCKPLLAEAGHFAYDKFVFICVENTEPYLVAVYELSPKYLAIGKHLYRRAAKKYGEARLNDFPGYPDDVRILEPPAWAQRAFIV